MRRSIAAIVTAVLVAAGVSIPMAAQADSMTLSQLEAKLTVASPNLVGYDRTLFGDWTYTTGDGCDTRANLLKAQTQVPVTFSSGCTVATGQWLSWYDNQTYTDASAVLIDHLVPLGEAWASGAANWTAQQRSDFANDTVGPELQIVTSSVNESKGDQDPTVWMPPAASAQCQYITDWVLEKYRWSMTVDTSEQSAITGYLANGGCGATTVTVPTVMIPPLTEATLPTVTATAICGDSRGSIVVTGGSGFTYRVVDYHSRTLTYNDTSALQNGYYDVIATVNNGSIFHTSNLQPGWGDLDHVGPITYATTTTVAYVVALEPTSDCGTSGSKLYPGDSLYSTDGLISVSNRFELEIQADGNLVVYNSSHAAIWNSHTNGHAGAHAEMQVDGNLVVYSPSHQALWNSGTFGHPGAFAVIQSDGNFVVYQGTVALFNGFADQPPSPELIDTTPTSQWVLPAGSQLNAGDQLTHGAYRATMQADGNFVVYFGSKALWNTQTFTAGSVLKVQADGNMVVYDPSGWALWSAQASGSGSQLKMQLDGNLVLYRGDGSPSWHRLHDTGTRLPGPPPPTAQYTLSAVGTMNGGDQLVYNNYRATMQTDGNFVVYNGATAVWNTGTNGSPGAHLSLQADGNVVIYNSSGTAIWATFTTGVTTLVMQADGNLVAYRGDGSAAWYRLHDTGRRIGAASPAGGSGVPANPGDSKNCSDFSTWAQAQTWYLQYKPYYGDVAHLDADGDGIACETLPGHP